MEKTDQNPLKNIWRWISKILVESLSGGISKWVGSVITIIITVILSHLQSLYIPNTITIPKFLFVILILFGFYFLVVFFVHIPKWLGKDTAKNTKLVKIKCGDSPREWQGECWFEGFHWHVKKSSIKVYCTRHNLRLIPRLDHYSPYIVTLCKDCADNYYDHLQGHLNAPDNKEFSLGEHYFTVSFEYKNIHDLYLEIETRLERKAAEEDPRFKKL